MKTRKKTIQLKGKLIGSLVLGKDAVVYSGGRLYHTSSVIKIHERTEEEIRFETVAAHYHVVLSPIPAAEITVFPIVEMAA